LTKRDSPPVLSLSQNWEREGVPEERAWVRTTKLPFLQECGNIENSNQLRSRSEVMSMAQVINAVFEDGILKPLQELNLTTHQVVRLVILAPRRQEREARPPAKDKREKLSAINWKDFFATKLKWKKKGPLDLSEVSIDALS
jgi:predicted DNA-binding antitoxin AbrB/MazE fold protein